MVKVSHQDAIIHPDDLKVLVKLIISEHDKTKRKVETIINAYMVTDKQRPIVLEAVHKSLEGRSRRSGS